MRGVLTNFAFVRVKILIFLYCNITFKSLVPSLFEDKSNDLYKRVFLNLKCDPLKLICSTTLQ